jgi:protein transport protein SEC13
VNSVCWAPHELGAILACASSDGRLSVLTFKSTPSFLLSLTYSNPVLHLDDGQWGADVFNGHAIGCNAVSWAPATIPGSLITPQQTTLPGQPPVPVQSVKRFASAGCDNLVKIWGFKEDTQSWVEEEALEGHTDWVRDVAWAPNIGLPRSYIATASQVRLYLSLCLFFLGSLGTHQRCVQDKTVLIWTKETPTSPWVKTALDPSSASPPSSTPAVAGKFPDVVWRVSWSLAGNILAVSCGDGKVTLWKENLRGVWECVSEMTS